MGIVVLAIMGMMVLPEIALAKRFGYVFYDNDAICIKYVQGVDPLCQTSSLKDISASIKAKYFLNMWY
jgi:hypothetical protein